MLNAKSSCTQALRLALIVPIIAAPLAWFAWTAYAATRNWDGGSALNSNWLTPENWNPNAAPAAGDDLVFDSITRSPSNNNFAVGTTFNTLTVRNTHRVTGNGIALSAGLTAGNSTIDLASIRLNNSQVFTAETAGLTANISSTIDFTPAVNSLFIQGPGNFNFTGAMNLGGFVQNGPGTTTLTGAAATLSTTSVWDGTLQLGKTGGSLGVGQVLSIGDGIGTINSATARMLASNQTQNNIFIAGSDGRYDLNNFSNSTTELTVNGGSVTIGTGTLTTSGLTMTGGNVSSTGAGKLLLGGNLRTFASASPATISGYIDLGGGTRTFTVDDGGASDDLNITAVIGNGGLTKAGTGLLALRGNNTYTATTTISAGRLDIRGDQPQSSVTVNGGTLAGTGTVGPVNATSGFVKPSLSGASFQILTVQGNLSLSSATTYVPVISFCPVGTTPNGIVNVVGTVNLGGSNFGLDVACGPPNFLPGQTYVVLSNDGTDAVTGQFSGLAEGAPIGIVLGVHITYRGGDGNDVALFVPTLTRVWTGGGGDNKWSTQANWEGGVVPRAGDSLEFPSAGAQKTNVNDLPAGLALNAINFSASGYAVSGNSVSLAGGLTASAGAQVGLARITLAANQTFSGPLAVTSEVDVNGKLLIIDTGVTISGAISGAGEIRRTGGVGTATLSGNNHNFTGATTIDFDTLAINGLQDQSPVTLSNVGRLAGSGTTGSVTATGASIRPSGILSVNGNLSLRRNATNGTGTLTININGTTPGSGYDQLNVAGAVNLNNNGTSPYSLTVTGAITPGAHYVIINNDGTDTVTGAFSGKSQNSTFKVGNRDVSISYTGNDGNDVVLTAVAMTFQWDGRKDDGTPSANANWMTKENWVGDLAPLPGDNLEFPDAADRKSNTNDFPAGTAFRSMTLSGAGYTLGLNVLSLSAGLTDTGAAGADNTITLPVTLAAPQTFASNAAGRQLILQGDVVVNQHQLTLGGTGGMKLSGIVTTLVSGSVAKTGTGTAEIAGAGGNNIIGGVTVSEGTLVLNKAAGSFAVHGLTVGDSVGAANSAVARLMQSNQIPDVGQVTVNADGRFELNGFTEAVGPLTVNDGNVTIGTGTLTTSGLTMTDGTVSSTGAGKLVLNGNVTANAAPTPATISGNLDLNGATRTFNVAFTEDGGLSVSAIISNGGLTKAGGGRLILSSNNTYSGTTAISAGTLQVDGGQLQSPVSVSGGALRGHGTVGPIAATGGSVRPQDNGSEALYAHGNVSFSSATTYSPTIKETQSFGFFGTIVNRLDVVGTVTLGGANLAPEFSGTPSFSGVNCCTYVLIANDGTDAVTGTFNGLSEGSLLSYHGQFLRLSYRGETDNNDVTLTVADRPTISIDDVSVNEGNSGQTNATFTVRLSEAISNAPATVAYATADGTATVGSDYVSTSGTLTFNPGETSKTVTALINGDTVNEADETFFVNLSNPTLATIADGQGQATIRNDDASTPNLPVVQFSSSAYVADEGAKFKTINVTRSGDTSAAVTVDYETSDGTASDRRDYALALGTLRFAAGETSKAFDVLLTDDGYAEPSETVNLLLSNPTGGAQLGGPAMATLTITDNEFGTPLPTNPIDDSSFFVRQQYHDFLNREPDQPGLAFWTNQITECGADANCTEVRRINVSAAFFLSIEFQETGYLVYRLQQASFGTGPLLTKRNFVSDSQESGRGIVVGAPGWEAQLEANKQAFVAGFVARQDFLSLYPPGMSAAEFIDKLNINTGGSLTQAERDDLVSRLNAGTITRAQAIRAVAQNANFSRRELNPAFVYMQYVGYLRRNPTETPDTTLEGYNFWLGKLNQFNGNFIEAEMVKAFLQSSEYRSRFGQ